MRNPRGDDEHIDVIKGAILAQVAQTQVLRLCRRPRDRAVIPTKRLCPACI